MYAPNHVCSPISTHSSTAFYQDLNIYKTLYLLTILRTLVDNGIDIIMSDCHCQ